MYRKIFVCLIGFFLVLSSIAFAGQNDSAKSSVSEGQNSITLGEPHQIDEVKLQDHYKFSEFEEDFGKVDTQFESFYKNVGKLVENQQKLLTKPDGQLYRKLLEGIEKLADVLEKGVEGTRKQNPKALLQIEEVKQEISENYNNQDCVWNYFKGTEQIAFKLRLTGEGRGIFDIQLNNNSTVEVRYAVGCDKGVTPNVTEHPVIAVMALPPNQGPDGSYALAYALPKEGETVAHMQWYPYPMDLEGAEWTAKQVYNLSDEDWDWITSNKAGPQEASENRYMNQ